MYDVMLETKLHISAGSRIYLFVRAEVSQAEVLLNTVGSEDQGGGEVFGLGDVTGDVGAFDHALLAIHGLDEGVGEPGRGVGHGEGGGPSSSLSFYNLGTSVLQYKGSGRRQGVQEDRGQVEVKEYRRRTGSGRRQGVQEYRGQREVDEY